MPAKRQGKIYDRERVELQDVLPLRVPFSIQIDICSACNMQCQFCFHSDYESVRKNHVRFGMMSYELFCKIIDDMKSAWGGVDKVKKLRLFKVGEPLLNPAVCDMVRYAKEAGVAELIEITTNGSLLTEKMSDGLISAGLDILNISVNGINEKQYLDVCNFKIDFDRFREDLKYYYEHKGEKRLLLKYSDIGYSVGEKEQFYKTFEDVCDEIFVETISGTLWQDTNTGSHVASTDRGIYGQPLSGKKVCPFLFTTMVINDRGVAHMCCVDWKMEYVLGDLQKEGIDKIWNGDKLKKYQQLHLLMKKDDIPLCRNCESLSANTIDDIDKYAQAIFNATDHWKDI